MGSGASKSVETVKAESFKQSTLTDESKSIINMHIPRRGDGGDGGAGAGVSGLWGGKDDDRRKKAARRAATTLEILKSPA